VCGYELITHFAWRIFNIKHEDILSELEKEINLEDIKSIQMTEKSCIVTLKSEQAKYKILNSEISLKNRTVNFYSVLLLSAYSRISNRPKLVIARRIGAQFNI
jgi:hypothetical protein